MKIDGVLAGKYPLIFFCCSQICEMKKLKSRKL